MTRIALPLAAAVAGATPWLIGRPPPIVIAGLIAGLAAMAILNCAVWAENGSAVRDPLSEGLVSTFIVGCSALMGAGLWAVALG